MDNELINFCNEKNILIDKPTLEIFDSLNKIEISKNIIERINYRYKQKIITLSFFKNNLEIKEYLLENFKNIDKNFIKELFLKLGLNLDYNLKKNIKKDFDLTKTSLNLLRIFENNPKKLEVFDFVKSFRSRYLFLKSLLQERGELDNLVSINKIESNKQISLIGLIYNKKSTKNGNILLEIEDLTGRVNAIINKDKEELVEKTKEILLDEVIGLKCSGSKEVVFVNDIIFPDLKIFEKKQSKYDESIAFISDIHVGSNKFLENNFLKFIKWINGELGNENQRKEALKIKYLLITGDSVDGVGVFPGQDRELKIKDVREQYKKLAELLSKIRSDIQIVICPGQHDAVRIAEPQPIISENYAEYLYYLKNINFVTNPSLIEIGKDVKFKILMYHGASMHGVINSIDKLRFGKGHDSPTDVVKYLLKKRHLAPTHSLVDYTPLEEDALLIKEVPDIISTGDLHRPEIANYNGVVCVASSCWQSITPFEEKVGNHPDPCKVPIFNLKTRELKIMDFSEGLEEGRRVIGGKE
jgi:DNA polymerase II small subunit